MKRNSTKILIIRFSAIGDIVWTTPVIRCLKQQLPGVELHYCTKTQYAEMLSNNPYIDKLYFLKNSLGKLIKELKKEDYDYIIDLHKNLRTTIIKSRLRKKAYSYNKLTFKRWLFVNFKINTMPKAHVADRYLDTIKPLGVYDDKKGLDYFIEPGSEVSLHTLPETHQQGYVVIVIGASEFTKKLPLQKLIELCEKIDHPIILIGGREDFEAGKELILNIKKTLKPQLFNACGIYSISQSASIVRQAEVVFGHDTGLTHIAAAFGKKIYAIFGGTSPLGFHPYDDQHTILENRNLVCRPCSKSGRKNCPKKHFKCMEDISFDFDLKIKEKHH